MHLPVGFSFVSFTYFHKVNEEGTEKKELRVVDMARMKKVSKAPRVQAVNK